MSTRPIFACDIDNTISAQYQRYQKFFDIKAGKIAPAGFSPAETMKDIPLPGAQDAINQLSVHYQIIWITARPPEMEELTRKWLKNHQFPLDDLILTEWRDKKIPILSEMKPCVYVDDMRYNYEYMDPQVTTDFMKKLEDENINYEIFEDNWQQITKKYLNLATQEPK